MFPVFLILYGGEDDSSRYGAAANEPYGAEDGYSSRSDVGDRYLQEFFNGANSYMEMLFDGANSYVDMLFGGDQNLVENEYRQREQEPYDGRNAADRSGGPTVIAVFYQDMYDPDYSNIL